MPLRVAGCSGLRPATPDPDRAQAGVDQDQAAHRARVHRAAAAGQARGPAHGLPGGRLPEHLRVLGRPRGHLPDRRRPVHPAVRLLPDRHRQAAAARPGRAAAGSPSRWPRWGCGTRPSPAWPATTCPTAGAWLYAQTAVEIHAAVPGCGVELLDARTSTAEPEQLGEVFAARPEVFAHNLETVPRIFRRIRPGVPLRAVARRAAPGRQGRGPGHQVQPDPRHGRDARRDQPGPGRPARGGLRPGHDHPVPAAVAAAPPGRALGPAGGVRRAARRRPARWGSPA